MSAPLTEYLASGPTLAYMSKFVQDSIGFVLESVVAYEAKGTKCAGSPFIAIWPEVDPADGVYKMRLQFGVGVDLPAAAVDSGVCLDLSPAVAKGKLALGLAQVREQLSSKDFLRELLVAAAPRLSEERKRFEGVAA
ncbi:hypothetical protein ACI2KT_01030 [Ensifer adhaerens]|uniref:hypothetical protein n=1 Tax=Ensifer adhaerens TaxID=106592 RepID=UPI00384C00C7